jgi:ribosomal protein L40E
MRLIAVADSERQLGVIRDILLPVDIPTRYDVYFTDKRIAIVCMGRSSRVDSTTSAYPGSLFGVAPALPYSDDKRANWQVIEEKINNLPLGEKLGLSRKSCFYTYEEIEEVKLISGKKPKFVVLSKDCISKFSPSQEQFKQLVDILPTIEMLKDKISIVGNLELNAPNEEPTVFHCKVCGSKNDVDALFCEGCGRKIREETEIPSELTCSSCGARNKVQALFCKKCGSSLSK